MAPVLGIGKRTAISLLMDNVSQSNLLSFVLPDSADG